MPKHSELDCRPYRAPAPLVDATGAPLSILELASRASSAANRWRDAIDSRADFTETLRAGGYLARVTSELATAIADEVATGAGIIELS